MKQYDLLEALGNIDPNFIEEADREYTVSGKRSGRPHYVRKSVISLAAAACLALAVWTVSTNFNQGDQNGSSNPLYSANDDTTTATGNLEDSAPLETQLTSQCNEYDMVELQGSAMGNKTESSSMNEICLKKEDFEQMSISGLEAYYGVGIVPQSILDTYEEEDAAQLLGIYQRSSGKIYYDQNKLTYCNNQGDTLWITVSSQRKLKWDTASLAEDTIGHYTKENKDCYEMGFKVDQVWFFVESNGMDQDTFTQLVQDFKDQQ